MRIGFYHGQRRRTLAMPNLLEEGANNRREYYPQEIGKLAESAVSIPFSKNSLHPPPPFRFPENAVYDFLFKVDVIFHHKIAFARNFLSLLSANAFSTRGRCPRLSLFAQKKLLSLLVEYWFIRHPRHVGFGWRGGATALFTFVAQIKIFTNESNPPASFWAFRRKFIPWP